MFSVQLDDSAFIDTGFLRVRDRPVLAGQGREAADRDLGQLEGLGTERDIDLERVVRAHLQSALHRAVADAAHSQDQVARCGQALGGNDEAKAAVSRGEGADADGPERDLRARHRRVREGYDPAPHDCGGGARGSLTVRHLNSTGATGSGLAALLAGLDQALEILRKLAIGAERGERSAGGAPALSRCGFEKGQHREEWQQNA